MGLTCPNETTIDQPLACIVSLKENNQTFTAFINYGDGSPEQQIQFNGSSLSIKKYYRSIGSYNIVVRMPQVGRVFRETVYMRRKFL